MAVDELLRMRRLANRLLLLAATDGPDFLRLAPVDVAELVVETLQRWSQTPRRWSLGTLPEASVQGDEDRLTLALDALIENAIDHTEVDDLIELSARCEGEKIILAVADSRLGHPGCRCRADLRPLRPDRRGPQPGDRRVRPRPGGSEGDR